MSYTKEEMKVKEGEESKAVAYGLPTRETLAALLGVADGAEGELIEHAFALGYRSIIRNHLKAGRGAPADLAEALKLAEIAAESRGGSGEALSRYRAGVVAFVEFAKSAGKSAKAQGIIKQLASNTKALALQPESIRDRMEANISAWADTLTDEQMVEHTRTIERMLEACNGVDLEAEDF